MITFWTFEVWLNATRENLVRWIVQERERSVEDWKSSHPDPSRSEESEGKEGKKETFRNFSLFRDLICVERARTTDNRR